MQRIVHVIVSFCIRADLKKHKFMAPRLIQPAMAPRLIQPNMAHRVIHPYMPQRVI